MKKKAVFFDRDDTLIIDSGYMHRTEQLEFFPSTFKVLRELLQKNYLLFIVTNQSGIGRGYFTEDDMHKFNYHMIEKLKAENIQITDISFCPHSPEEICDCRKPKPKMINDLCERYEIDKSLSYMVGDKTSDIEAGKNAGLISIKVEEDLAAILNSIT